MKPSPHVSNPQLVVLIRKLTVEIAQYRLLNDGKEPPHQVQNLAAAKRLAEQRNITIHHPELSK